MSRELKSIVLGFGILMLAGILCGVGFYVSLPVMPAYPDETAQPLLPTFTPRPAYVDSPVLVPGLTIQSTQWGTSYRIEKITYEKCVEALFGIFARNSLVVYFTTNNFGLYGEPVWEYICVPVGVTGDYYRRGLTIHAEVDEGETRLYLQVPADWQVVSSP